MTTTTRTTLRPATVEELSEAVADTADSHPQLLVGGTGTATGWGAPADPADATVDTTKLTGVLRYNPADMTIAVRAGTPLTDIQRTLAKHGQRLAFDPARTTRGATIGGLLATADAGPLRTGYGSLRDLVIGVTMVLADGTIAHSGSHVIKNVAGYDLAKLLHGSLGTLGVIAEVILRVHPQPWAVATVAVDCPPEDAFALTGKVVAAGLDAVALEWCDGQLLIKLEGTERGVSERARAVGTLAPGARVLSPDEAGRSWAQVEDTAEGATGATVLRVGTLPSAGPHTLAEILTWAGESGVHTKLSSSVPVGVHTVRLSGGSHDRLLALAHQNFETTVTMHRGEGLDPASGWGPPPPAVAVMRAVKRHFDPAGRFGSGRFTPWLNDEERTS